MKSKTKLIIPIALLALLAVFVIVYFVRGTTTSESGVKVVNYGFSMCTQDVPSTHCSSYEVTIQTADGRRTTYEAAGFSGGNSESYDKLRSKIAQAKEQQSLVTLRVKSKKEIVSVN